MDIFSNVNRCKGELSKFYSELDWSQNSFETLCKTLSVDLTEQAIFLELVFRYHLKDLLENIGNAGIDNNSDVFKLLRFSFDFALHIYETTPMFGRVPFVLLEDILDSQTIHNAESVWTVVESLEDKIVHPDLFAKGKYNILKSANSLLRQLSKTCNTEFCGRILLFLAAVYPISDKSGLNVAGKVNSTNVTYFEDEETFLKRQNEAEKQQETAAADGVVDTNGSTEMNVEMETAVVEMTVDGDEEKSPTSVKMNVTTTGEDGEEIEVLVTPTGDVTSTSKDANEKISYELYSAFWTLQKCFIGDVKTVDKPAWKDFVSRAKQTIALFESVDKTETSSRNHKDNNNDNDSGVSIDNADYMGCKFLTSSELFELQLRDPMLRQQISVQLLYFIHYIRTKLPVTLTADNDSILELSRELLFIHDKANKIIEKADPVHGHDMIATIRRLLSRESQWIAWKNVACIPFQRNIPSTTSFVSISTDGVEDPVSLKRKADQALLHSKTTSDGFKITKKLPRGKKTSAVKTGATQFEFDISDHNVKEKARELLDSFPAYETVIQQFIDADDPEAGIDPEYHPKLDNVLCWRTRRLLAANHLDAFEAMSDGDISKGFRKLSGKEEIEPVAAEAVIVVTPLPTADEELTTDVAVINTDVDADADAEATTPVIVDSTEVVEEVEMEENPITPINTLPTTGEEENTSIVGESVAEDSGIVENVENEGSVEEDSVVEDKVVEVKVLVEEEFKEDVQVDGVAVVTDEVEMTISPAVEEIPLEVSEAISETTEKQENEGVVEVVDE